MGAAAFEGCHGALDGGQVIRRHFVGLGAPNQMAKGSFIVLDALLLVLVQLLAALVQGSAYLRQKVLRLIDGVHQVAAESVLRGAIKDYLKTDEGKRQLEINCGCWNWGDVDDIPGSFFLNYGLGKITPLDVDIIVDRNESFADEN